MGKMRVHEISKALLARYSIKIENKDLIAWLNNRGWMEIKSASNSLDETEANEVIRRIAEERKPELLRQQAAKSKQYVLRRKAPAQPQPVPEAAQPAAEPEALPELAEPVTVAPAASAESAAQAASELSSEAAAEAQPHVAQPVQELRVVAGIGRKREFIDVQEEREQHGGRVREVTARKELVEFRERLYRPARVKKRPIKKTGKKTEVTVPKAIKRIVKMTDKITVNDLAKRIGVKAQDLIYKLMKMGMMVALNQQIDLETAQILCMDYGYEVENVAFDEEQFIEEVEDRPEDLKPRPPVVTIMGHVDHGKTTLLDAIRHTSVADGEAGGITQHIGAYTVDLAERGSVTFIDTPGHEAFTAMRARGASVTDVVVLVVAADEGVKPQTLEAINHAREAEVPIIVAVNKIDKVDADPERVRQALSEQGLLPEKWGGETIYVDVSARQKKGMDALLEMILLQAEVLELKANPDKLARGSIIEAKLDRGRGPVATVIVEEGTLKIGDPIVSGQHSGKVRALLNDKSISVLRATPGQPVEVIGLSGVPRAGDMFHAVADDHAAKLMGEQRALQQKSSAAPKTAKVTLEDLFKKVEEGDAGELKLIIKADVQGTVEALSKAIDGINSDKAKVKNRIIHTGVGEISEGDINLASASSAVILGFNVRSSSLAQQLAEQQKVQVKFYSVIYDAIDDVRKAMEGLLKPVLREKWLGKAEIRGVFKITKVGIVAGAAVLDGKITRNALVRVFRNQEKLFDGRLASLKHFKEDVKEAASGSECGMSFEGYQDIQTGDIIEAYEIEQVASTLSN